MPSKRANLHLASQRAAVVFRVKQKVITGEKLLYYMYKLVLRRELSDSVPKTVTFIGFQRAARSV